MFVWLTILCYPIFLQKKIVQKQKKKSQIKKNARFASNFKNW